MADASPKPALEADWAEGSILNRRTSGGVAMTCKDRVTELIERMPEELVREVQHYAEYLYVRSQHEEWSRTSLGQLALRYAGDDVEYTMDDLRR